MAPPHKVPGGARRNPTTQEKLEEYSIPEPNSGCWIWLGGRTGAGYGTVKRPGTTITEYAHRLSYETFVGPVPAGLQIDHLCRNPSCINSAHLEPVTNRENTRRGNCALVNGARGRAKTHCLRGHPLSGENLSLYRGRRACRTCRKVRKWERKMGYANS